MVCACDKLIGPHDDSPEMSGFTQLESTTEPDRYGLVLYSAKYCCNTCQRELMMYGENTSSRVSISRS